jgi:hypothetical protein
MILLNFSNLISNGGTFVIELFFLRSLVWFEIILLAFNLILNSLKAV